MITFWSILKHFELVLSSTRRDTENVKFPSTARCVRRVRYIFLLFSYDLVVTFTKTSNPKSCDDQACFNFIIWSIIILLLLYYNDRKKLLNIFHQKVAKYILCIIIL